MLTGLVPLLLDCASSVDERLRVPHESGSHLLRRRGPGQLPETLGFHAEMTVAHDRVHAEVHQLVQEAGLLTQADPAKSLPQDLNPVRSPNAKSVHPLREKARGKRFARHTVEEVVRTLVLLFQLLQELLALLSLTCVRTSPAWCKIALVVELVKWKTGIIANW